jgi:hypothetical protein
MYILLLLIILMPISKSYSPNVGSSIPDSVAENYNDGSSSDSSSTASSSNSNSVKNYYTNFATDAIDINQFTDYSLIENGLPIYGEVGITKEIRNSLAKEIKGLTICERIDKNVDIKREPVCYITYFGNKSSKIMSKLRNYEKIDVRNDTSGEISIIIDDESTRSFYIPYLGPKGRVIIYYRILSRNVGMVQLGTSIRYDEKEYHDNDYYFKLKSEFPVKISATPQNSKLFTGYFNLGPRSTSIAYDLEYRNESSVSNNKSVNVTIESKCSYYEIRDVSIGNDRLGSSQIIDKKYNYTKNINQIGFVLPFGKNVRIMMVVDYLNEGEYNMPYIFLDNNRILMNSDKILVEDYINSRSSVIYLVIINFVVLICTCILTVYTMNLNRKNNQNNLRVYSEHQKGHLDQICTSTDALQKEIKQLNIALNIICSKIDGIKELNELKWITKELREIKDKIK